MTSPLFISLDGIDGAGKSTQIDRLRSWLTARGREVVLCRDPGSTRLGDEIRRLVLGPHDIAIAGRCELMLYMAARAQLVDEVIRPALQRGQDVISDRYLLANVVYQGHAGRLAPELAWQVGAIATDNLMPDLTIVLDLPVDIAWQRLNRAHDRMESRGVEYLEAVRAGFLAEASAHEHIQVIDAEAASDEVEARIRACVTSHLTRQ